MYKITSVLCILALTGCMTYAVCEEQRQADLVELVWESEFGDPLTPEQSACLHAFSVKYVSSRLLPHDSIGMTIQRRRGAATIRILEGMDADLTFVALRHELTHRIAYCVMDSTYGNHNHEIFAYSGVVNTEGSIAALAVDYDPGFVCE